MTPILYLPSDEFSDAESPNLDLAADYLELSAIFSKDSQSFSEDIVSTLEISAEEEYCDVEAEIENREEIATAAVAHMSYRKEVLTTSYPFEIDRDGSLISYTGKQTDFGHTAYVVALILSNLQSMSPLLAGSGAHPAEQEVRRLRQYFQYLATAAIAAEVGGPAWSFGFPRPDGTGFITKLSEIWSVLGDGKVDADPSAPLYPKDDKIDIFAWREHKDGLPGFLLIAAQVATGSNWKEKSIKGHVSHSFPLRWFSQPPAAVMIAYHVIPFARPEETFRDDVALLGNVLHRLRVPFRVSEAARLVSDGVDVEAFDLLSEVSEWVQSYLERTRAQ